jgi:hypothetical protein
LKPSQTPISIGGKGAGWKGVQIFHLLSMQKKTAMIFGITTAF